MPHEQFHGETTGQQPTAPSTEATLFNNDNFEQWDSPSSQRQPAPRPSAPSRQSQSQRPPIADIPVEFPEVPVRAPAQSNTRFTQPDNLDVDYRDVPLDEFATSELPLDQFADYDVFDDRENFLFLFLIDWFLIFLKSRLVSSKQHWPTSARRRIFRTTRRQVFCNPLPRCPKL